MSKELGVYGFIGGKIAYHNESHSELMVPDRDLLKLHYELLQNEFSAEPVLSANFWTPAEILSVPEVRKIAEEPYYQDLIKKYHTQRQSVSCQAHDKIAIQSDGTVYLCLEALSYNIAPLGNYKENSMLEIWENRWDNALFKPRKIENMVCNKCKYNTYCNSGCMVKAYVTSKNFNNPQISSCKPNL